jgi:quercetin 2,3-dioxygenase
MQRGIVSVSKSVPTTEGAGVSLRRAFGFGKTEDYDPFLLLDDFRGDDPAAYAAGFPWHPHRGIETITYMLAGSVEHQDSLGNSGTIRPGEVQWMTAGSGIIHQEMPKPDDSGRMYGFQLWANLPTAKKMTAPRYQQYGSKEIPRVQSSSGAAARIICGELWGLSGPVEGIGVDPACFDIELPAGVSQEIPIAPGRHAFAYVIAGGGFFCGTREPFEVPQTSAGWADTVVEKQIVNHHLLLFSDGDAITVRAGDEGIRFLLVSGNPLGEPVAWYGPIVMNTREELQTAFRELEEGTFLDSH